MIRMNASASCRRNDRRMTKDVISIEESDSAGGHLDRLLRLEPILKIVRL